MRSVKHSIIFLLLFLMPAWTVAQKKKQYEGSGNWFVGIETGTTLAMAENVTLEDFFVTEVPGISIQLGRTITPWAALRLTAGYHSQLGHASNVAVKFDPETYAPYRFFMATATMDLMLNLVNMCRRYDVRNFYDGYLVMGGGLLNSLGFDKKVDLWDEEIYPVNSADVKSWTAKVGFMNAWHMNRSWDLTAELDFHATENAYNGVVDRPDRKLDFFLTLKVGTTYYFRNGKGRHRYANAAKKHLYW